MYINISRYAGAAGRIGEAAPKVQQGFVPMLRGQRGFHGYAAFASDQGDIVAVTIWENADALANSREKIPSWVTGNLKGFDKPTERFHGEVGQHAFAAPQNGGQGQSLRQDLLAYQNTGRRPYDTNGARAGESRVAGIPRTTSNKRP
jgi:hypothetical protein